MLFVETYVAPSPVHGLGLFAAQPITKGAMIWEFTPGFDLELSNADLERLSEPCRQRVLWYAYFSVSRMRYILCSDDARFINDSAEPNTASVDFDQAGEQESGRTIAARDIAAGEELTEDYTSFEESTRNSMYGIMRQAASGES